MANIAVTKSLSGGLVAFFQQADNITRATQSQAGVWGTLNSDTSVSGGSHFVQSTLAQGDNGTQPVFGVVVTTPNAPTKITLTTNTSVANGDPLFSETSIPAPATFTPSMLALTANSHMMVADASRVFALRNTGAVTPASWAPVSLPAGAAVRSVAMSTSRLFANVPEAFALTDSAVLHATANASGVWSPFSTLNTAVPARGIAVAPNGNNLVDAVILARDGRILHAHQTPQGASPVFLDWRALPALNQPVFGPSANSNSIALARVVGGANVPLLTVFVLAQNGLVFTAQQSAPDSNVWNDWRALPASPEIFTSLVVPPGATQNFDALAATAAHLFHGRQTVLGSDPWIRF